MEPGSEIQWRVVWFPPEAAQRMKTVDSEDALAGLLSSPEIAEWHPIVEQRVVGPWKIVQR